MGTLIRVGEHGCTLTRVFGSMTDPEQEGQYKVELQNHSPGVIVCQQNPWLGDNRSGRLNT
jgi:hypothetical protein